jgi:pSer/pThr/pTyr-binding forkhead associated (FHA) protein
MKLHYSKQDGESKDFELGEQSITIGRSPDADIILLDEKVSRVHCGVRFWDGEFYIKDLKSKNGTFVNGHRVEVAKLSPADVIKVGSYNFTFEQPAGPGTETALREISGEMDLGKGYSTLLKEIVQDSKPAEPEAAKPAPETPPPPATSAPSIKPAAPPPASGPRKLPVRPPLRINIKRPGE